MKTYNIQFLTTLLFAFSLCLIGCGDDDSSTSFDYAIDILTPDAADKKMGDMLPIQVRFKSETAMTVHNIKVKIYNVADTSVVAYEQPEGGHVHEESGIYTYEDMVMLSHGNGFHMLGDWVLEASVSGDAGEEEVVEQVMFHIHPGDEIDFAYHAHIKSPLVEVQPQGSELSIEVEFESHTGQIVHHVNVKIFNKADNSNIVYNLPGDAHVHAIEGEYTHYDKLMLDSDAGFLVDSEWVLEASAWGPSGAGKVTEQKEFTIQ